MKYLLLVFFLPNLTRASVLLGEVSEWQLQMSGFVEADYSHDSRPSFLETAGNYPILGPDTPRGQGDRGEVSVRNSRFGFALLPPGQETWKPKAYVEFDFLGNRLDSALAGSNDTYFTQPSLRVRHLYLRAEHEGWHYLTGQYWTLFGWVPTYVLATASVAPGPGSLYQRKQQLTAIKDWEIGAQGKLQLGLSLAQASQTAGGVPNVDAAAKYSFAGRSAGFAAPSEDIQTQPLSVALSGTMRKFSYGSVQATSPDLHKLNAYAVAVDTMIPVLASSDGKETANTMTLTAEWTAGTGYGDEFPGWSGNLPNFPFSAANQDTYMGKGQGGFDQAGTFYLFQLHSWNTQVQYHLPGPHKCFVTAGHSQLSVSNLAGLGPVPGGFMAYDQVAMNFVNLFHDFTSQIRGAVEYARFTTHYLSGNTVADERYQISAFYRF